MRSNGQFNRSTLPCPKRQIRLLLIMVRFYRHNLTTEKIRQPIGCTHANKIVERKCNKCAKLNDVPSSPSKLMNRLQHRHRTIGSTYREKSYYMCKEKIRKMRNNRYNCSLLSQFKVKYGIGTLVDQFKRISSN
jgi:hypothetical protein